MKSSITLHEKYGLNPTLLTCFYCGEETGEIALLSASYKGEAPMHLCTNLNPCPECREKFKDCVMLIETRRNESNSPTPTGRWVAIKKECVTVPNNGICYTDTETMNKLQSLTV